MTNTGVTKVYDGTTNVPAGFTPAFSASGLAKKDTGLTITGTGSAYNSADVLGASGIDLAGLALAGITGSNGSLASDYSLKIAQPWVAASITPAPIGVSLGGFTLKLANNSTDATLAPSNFSVSGVVPGESLNVNQTLGRFATSAPGTNINVSTTLDPSNYVAGAATKLSNYLLPTGYGEPGGTISMVAPIGMIYVNAPQSVCASCSTAAAGKIVLVGQTLIASAGSAAGGSTTQSQAVSPPPLAAFDVNLLAPTAAGLLPAADQASAGGPFSAYVSAAPQADNAPQANAGTRIRAGRPAAIRLATCK